MYIGLDIGTSGVKAVLVDENQDILANASAPLSVQRPRPLWSEQDPDALWQAVAAVMAALRSDRLAEYGAVRGIGMSGKMHGATLLDADDKVLRPAILWNDQRTGPQCDEIRKRVGKERLVQITGNDAMTGFTAPKILPISIANS